MEAHIFKNLFTKNNESLTNAALKDVLSSSLTPLLAKMGLAKYDGEFLWYSDFNQEGIRRVFKYAVIKGNAGVFTWGICLKHIPTVSASRKLQYHKTEQNIALHLWEWPRGYSVSLEKDVLPTELVSHSNERECKRTVQEIFSRYRSEMAQWYKTSDALSGCLEIANSQIAAGGMYSLRWPTANYVKIFLLALMGSKAEAKQLLTTRSQPASKGNSEWKSVAEQIAREIDAI